MSIIISKIRNKYKVVLTLALLITVLPFASIWLEEFSGDLLGDINTESPNTVEFNKANTAEITPPVYVAETELIEDKKQESIEVSQPSDFLVTKVIDGDTIEIEGGQTIRYIGIDTPETVNPNSSVECFGKEASNKNRDLLEGKRVKLEKDVSEADKYGRLLRYVWVGDVFVNDYLVKEGYANALSYPPDVKYQSHFRVSETEARNSNKGLWRSCSLTTPKPTPSVVTPTTPTQTSCMYSCSSPDRECADFSTHNEAQSFFSCCGFTVTNDPMKLDGTGVDDDVACESLP